MVDQVGCCLHNGPHRVEGSEPLGSVEWSSLKYDGVKLLEWSPKVEWNLWSRAAFLEVELSQTDPNCSTGSHHD